MKETIKKKMDAHIEKILAKEEISNEDYYLLNMLYQKIEGEERLAEMEAKNERDREEGRKKQKELYESIMKNLTDLG
ncbi:MAG: hypothetical protein HDR01_05655 [Lachnospiraceae bacterium]|nr:hypothetical protein [Lachnospiraceae bacterium]